MSSTIQKLSNSDTISSLKSWIFILKIFFKNQHFSQLKTQIKWWNSSNMLDSRWRTFTQSICFKNPKRSSQIRSLKLKIWRNGQTLDLYDYARTSASAVKKSHMRDRICERESAHVNSVYPARDCICGYIAVSATLQKRKGNRRREISPQVR